MESNINNITNLAYNLDFALKRIERHLELSSIHENKATKNSANIKNKNEYNVANKPEIKQESLSSKSEGVLGFIKESNSSWYKYWMFNIQYFSLTFNHHRFC